MISFLMSYDVMSDSNQSNIAIACIQYSGSHINEVQTQFKGIKARV